MNKPVKHTHNLIINRKVAATRDTTVGGVYPAELCPTGGWMHDGTGFIPSAFIAFVNDVGGTCILKYVPRDDIELHAVPQQHTTTGPSVVVHTAVGIFRDCIPGKEYPAKKYEVGDIDAAGIPTTVLSLGFHDEAGDFVKWPSGHGLATFNW